MLYGGSRFQQYNQVPSNNTIQPNKNSNIGSTGNWIYTLINLTFLGLVIYSLDSCNIDAVFAVCGRDLWNYMVTRLTLGSLGFLVLTCIVCTIGIEIFFNFGNGTGNPNAGMLYCGIFLVLVYHLTFIGIGAQVTTDTMKNRNCTSALSDASFTHSPLLAQLGYVFLAFDCLWVFLMIVVACMACFAIRFIRQQGG